MKKIRVAVVGVGNCAKSLIEGVALYTLNKSTEGLAFPDIGGYKASDIEFVLAYDVDKRKVGLALGHAIYQKPNCAINILEHNGFSEDDVYVATSSYPIVQMGKVLDGVSEHMSQLPEDEAFLVSDRVQSSLNDVVNDLLINEVDILLNYLPVGSEEATRFYVEACLLARVPFVNCIPVFIVS